ncbi:TRL domain-containing protein [Rickettsiales bacterium LUAb2]
MKKISFILLLLALATVSGCATAPNGIGVGFINSNTTPFAVTNGSVAANKSGEACASNILGLVVTGDMSIDKAKTNGSIASVSSVDIETSGIAPIFIKRCTIVKGN